MELNHQALLVGCPGIEPGVPLEAGDLQSPESPLILPALILN